MNAWITRHERAPWIVVVVLGILATVTAIALAATGSDVLRAIYNAVFLCLAITVLAIVWPRRHNGPSVTLACPDCGEHITLPVNLKPGIITVDVGGEQDIYVHADIDTDPSWAHWEQHLMGGAK